MQHIGKICGFWNSRPLGGNKMFDFEIKDVNTSPHVKKIPEEKLGG